MRKIQKYSEAIYGNMAAVYHRTSYNNFVRSPINPKEYFKRNL